jgi:UDP-N-acetylglucosamine--N-acetylmuramyl-(pentapeptide) pyrophosphoryl-undecaprenol N-acetylglucosamine transferase
MSGGSSIKLVIAGGGSGGHVFPGIAIADELRRIDPGAEITFVGTARGLESRLVPASGYALEMLEVEPMVGGGAARVIRGGLVAARATVRARSLVKRLRPDVVLSVGGYAAGPLSLAARTKGVPLVVVEPNATMGLANKLLAPVAARVYVAFSELAAKIGARARLVGVPLRAVFVERSAAASASAEPRFSAEGNVPPRVLVLGGSHGAAPLNDRLPSALARVAESFPSLEIVHQTGRDRVAKVRERYDQLKVAHVDVVPFIEDVAAALTRADVVVARAGAITVAEVSALGRAAIFVPFAAAAGNHQYENASALARGGACVCIAQEAADDTRIAMEIEGLLRDDAARGAMEAAARAAGRTDGAAAIARDLLALTPRMRLVS